MTDDLKVSKPMINRVVAKKPPYRMFDNEPASTGSAASSSARPSNRYKTSLIPPTVAPVAPVPPVAIMSPEVVAPIVSGPVSESSGR